MTSRLLFTPTIYAENGASTALSDITQPLVQHIILLISDGMGDAEINAVRNYPKGAGGFFSSTNQT